MGKLIGKKAIFKLKKTTKLSLVEGQYNYFLYY